MDGLTDGWMNRSKLHLLGGRMLPVIARSLANSVGLLLDVLDRGFVVIFVKVDLDVLLKERERKEGSGVCIDYGEDVEETVSADSEVVESEFIYLVHDVGELNDVLLSETFRGSKLEVE